MNKNEFIVNAVLAQINNEGMPPRLDNMINGAITLANELVRRNILIEKNESHGN